MANKNEKSVASLMLSPEMQQLSADYAALMTRMHDGTATFVDIVVIDDRFEALINERPVQDEWQSRVQQKRKDELAAHKAEAAQREWDQANDAAAASDPEFQKRAEAVDRFIKFAEGTPFADEVKGNQAGSNRVADGIDPMLRIGDVLLMTSLGRSKVYSAIADGTFPKQIQLDGHGYRVGWLKSSIQGWLDACARGQVWSATPTETND